MPAIHMICRCRGIFLMVMRGNRALAGGAAGHLIRRPRSSRQRRVKRNDRKQTHARVNGTPAIVTRSLHAIQNRYLSSDTIALNAIVYKLNRKWLHTIQFTIRQMLLFFAAGRPIPLHPFRSFAVAAILT